MDKNEYIKNLEQALGNLINFCADDVPNVREAFLDAYPEHRDTMEKARA